MLMEDMEQRASATSSVNPFFLKRYVNDVISVVSGNEVECLSSHLNSVKPSIQIALEHEKDRHLPFLDFNVYRGEQRNLETSVYRKPNHTDKYLSFVSLVLNVNGYPKTFLHNCRKLVTTSSTLDEREPVTSFAVIPYIQGVTEPIKRILNTHNA